MGHTHWVTCTLCSGRDRLRLQTSAPWMGRRSLLCPTHAGQQSHAGTWLFPFYSTAMDAARPTLIPSGAETAVSISHPGGRTPLCPLCPSIWGSACVWVCRLHPSQDVQLLKGAFQSQIPGQEGPRAHRPRLGTAAALGGPHQRAPSFGFFPEKGSPKTQGKRQRQGARGRAPEVPAMAAAALMGSGALTLFRL